MAENKLTDRHLRNLKPSDIEQAIGDGGGLWVRILPISKGGSINFYYRFQFGGKERRFNCGSYPETSLAQAREKRNTARSLVKSGVDPVFKEENDRIARTTAQAMERMEKTVTDLFEDWKRVYLSAHRRDGGAAVEAAINRDVLPVIGSLKAKDVRLPHVVQVIDRILERNARRTANMVLSLMRQMFRHGLGRGIVETDPTLSLTKKQAGGKESPVERNLTFDEIKALHVSLGNCGLPVTMQAAIRFLLATGARVGELLNARWSDIDQSNATWTIPAANSKNGRPHLIHLSAYAKKQLAYLKIGRPGPFLMNGIKPNTSMSDKSISKAIRDRIRSVPLQRRTPHTQSLLLANGEWSAHDLRRSMASRMGDLGVEPHIIERCLNHVQQGIVGVYQRQEYMKERKAAFDKWGRKLSSLSNGK